MKLIEAAGQAYTKINTGSTPPVARVSLATGEQVFFNGLVVQPLGGATGVFIMHGDPSEVPALVVRDEHVVFGEFGGSSPVKIGFGP